MGYFLISAVGEFMTALNGILGYICLRQSSIEYWSRIQPVASEMIVCRGLRREGKKLAPLYESMIDEIIVWPRFTSASTDRQLVLSRFIEGEDSLLFEMDWCSLR
jgi:hypothetical protein